MIMKYKVGDKVKVKSNLLEGFCYGGNGSFVCTKEMANFSDKIVTISSVHKEWGTYGVKEYEDFCWWYDNMFENEIVDKHDILHYLYGLADDLYDTPKDKEDDIWRAKEQLLNNIMKYVEKL